MKSFFKMLYVHTLCSISVFMGTGNLCTVFGILQEQRPISLKVMSILGSYKCKEKKEKKMIFPLSHLDNEVC